MSEGSRCEPPHGLCGHHKGGGTVVEGRAHRPKVRVYEGLIMMGPTMHCDLRFVGSCCITVLFGGRIYSCLPVASFDMCTCYVHNH